MALDLKNALGAVKQPLCSASRLERAIGVIYRCAHTKLMRFPAPRLVSDDAQLPAAVQRAARRTYLSHCICSAIYVLLRGFLLMADSVLVLSHVQR